MPKQILMVLEAINDGCRTSAEVADETGLPLKSCSSYLSQLAEDGLVNRTEQPHASGRGRSFNWYAPSEEFWSGVAAGARMKAATIHGGSVRLARSVNSPTRSHPFPVKQGGRSRVK